MDEYIDAMTDDMQKAVEALASGFTKVRTGRASPALIEAVQVNVHAYGTSMPLNQLATIQAPDARLLVDTPWDKTTLGDIEKSIIAAGLGLNPSNDGKIVRVPVPPLTAERRQDLVKQVRKLAEDTKVRLRHIRRDYNDIFKNGEKEGELSEDDLRKMLDQVQEITDAAIKRVDELGRKKEEEVQEV